MKQAGLIYLIIILFTFSLIAQDIENEDTPFYDLGIQYLYTDYDSSIYYLEKSIENLEGSKHKEKYVDCYNALFIANWYRGDFSSAEKYLMNGQEKALDLISPKSKIYGDLLNNLGMYYSTKGMVKKGISYYLNSSQNLDDRNKKIVPYANSAINYASLKDYNNATFFIEEALSIIANNEINTDLKEGINTIAGRVFYDKKDFKKSIKYLTNSYLILDNSKKTSNYFLDSKVNVINFLLLAYIESGDFDHAKKLVPEVLNIHEDPDIQFKYLTFNALGKLYERTREFNKAKNTYQIAIKEVLKQQSEFELFDIIAWEYTDLAALEFKINELDSALHTIHTAVSYFAKDVDRSQPLTTPKIEDFVYRGKVLRTLTLKAQILQALYQKSENPKELQAAYDTYQLAAELAKLIRQDIMTQGSKQKLAGEVLPIYEGGIETALALYELTKDEQYKNTAFQFAESNKAILLLESMNDNDAKNYSSIPDSLLEKDNQLKIEITFYEKNINQERSKKEGIDEEKIKNWESSLFDLNTEYQALIELLEEQYPKYYELKYATKLTTPQDLQNQLLSSSDALIEYFVGEHNIYAFVISKDDFTITTIEKPESFQEDIDLFLYHTKRPGKTDTDFRLSLEAQHDYYVKYVQPAIQSLPTSIKRLIIIPDDVFNYIPFELFITSPIPAEDTRFSPKEHDYLFEQYIMTYNYSATLLQKSYEQKKKGKAENMLLAMAPNFNKNAIAANQSQQRACTIFDIYDLACSDKEVQEISEMMGGDYFIGQDADKATFEKIAKDYRILHLATHSCPDEEDPNFSKIFLADEAITNYDLFNYEFNADLAVLSACNTGFGKLVKGEGVMPLSKGFIQAGIPSTVMSLWPVDDCGTSRMMKLLYQYLDEGLPKDEALQKAKLDFIQNSNAIYQHPYYWSAFIHMGNFEPIHERSSIPPVIWWMLGGGMLALLGWIWKKKSTKMAA